MSTDWRNRIAESQCTDSKVEHILKGIHCQWSMFSNKPLSLSVIRQTVKPVFSGHSKKDQKWVFKTNYRLMQVKSIAEFCNTFDLHWVTTYGFKTFVLFIFEGFTVPITKDWSLNGTPILKHTEKSFNGHCFLIFVPLKTLQSLKNFYMVTVLHDPILKHPQMNFQWWMFSDTWVNAIRPYS